MLLAAALLASPRAATADQAPRPSSPAPAPKPSARADSIGLTAIRRDVLPDALRITLALDRDTAFTHERLDGPPRVVVDLDGTAAGSLSGRELSFDDDVVRAIRVVSLEGQRTRVVLDLEGAGRHSVYALSRPYRVVIDLERALSARVRLVPRPLPFPVPREAAPVLPDESVTVAAELSAEPPAVDPAAAAPVAALGGDVPAPVAGAPANFPPAPSTDLEGGFSLSRQLGLGISRIVIDPGHGGRDPGSRGRGLVESEVVLDVALRLEALLLAQPGIEVVLTRRTNVFVPLEERTAIANREQADLFLSIHANASRDIRARGIETFFLNFARDPEAEALAARENAESAQTMRSLPNIVQAIALNNKIDESRDFAAILHRAVYSRLSAIDRRVEDRGVKQAPFVVLIGAAMPSVLAEVSFLTNQQEADLLRTDRYRQWLAEALLEGVQEYQYSLRIGVVASQER